VGQKVWSSTASLSSPRYERQVSMHNRSPVIIERAALTRVPACHKDGHTWPQLTMEESLLIWRKSGHGSGLVIHARKTTSPGHVALKIGGHQKSLAWMVGGSERV